MPLVPVAAKTRSATTMQYYDQQQQGYSQQYPQQGYDQQPQSYNQGFSQQPGGYSIDVGQAATQIAQVQWSLFGTNGVIGFSGVAGFAGEHDSRHYQQDYRFLPYTLSAGEDQVLSRWNMVTQKLTVSRVQCSVAVASDGTATLTSKGKGPTLWRSTQTGGQWYAVNKDETCPLSDGDQIALDWHNAESAVFTVQAQVAGGYDQSYQQQQGGYAPYQQQGGYPQHEGYPQQGL